MKLDLVDVFASGPLSGNPLGVVHGGGELSPEQMLAITRWLGFSEVTFLLPPSDPAADYRVRIFYPAGELPFAGHPTLGSAHAWLAAGGTPKRPGRIVQECGVGLVEVRQDGDRLGFRAPPLVRSGPLSEAELGEALRVSGADPARVVEAVHVANGPNWVLLRLDSAEAVLAAEPAAKAAPGTDVGLAGPCPAGSAADWELRAFFAKGTGQMAEDPVTGSFNAGVAMHLFATGLARGSYLAAQGRKTGADGLVHASQDDEGVWIGGRVRMVSAGGDLTPPA
ncbi:PhzF family phenazine biosynthesis protein [Novosphingobium sp. TH158]|uniref:PhzF family phenazine biosynthesis protein n=1 Tax=Novosphingobium sp. TH158 TaxID=2067455 RepID=UPI000C7E2892|nr:PhzF family phenazine biosynthesis protein [Novosphingobium sp. TH158]PLK26424.1 phenazine biosynthesis protein PhzF [Novosphingobium sp. TH158]